MINKHKLKVQIKKKKEANGSVQSMIYEGGPIYKEGKLVKKKK